MIDVKTIREIVIAAWTLSGEDGIISSLNFLNKADDRSSEYVTYFNKGVTDVIQDCLAHNIIPVDLMVVEDVTGAIQANVMSFTLASCKAVDKIKDLTSNKYVRRCKDRFEFMEAKTPVYLKLEFTDELLTRNTSDNLRASYVTSKIYQPADLSDPVSVPTTPDMRVLLDYTLLACKIGANYAVVMGGDSNMIRQQKFEGDYLNRLNFFKSQNIDRNFVFDLVTHRYRKAR